jgi:hypothetical protein
MATQTELEQLVVRLVGDAASYQKMINDSVKTTQEAAAHIEQLTHKIEGFGNTLKNFASNVLGGLGVLGIGTGLMSSFSQYDQFEKAQLRMRAAVEANGRAAGPAIEEYKKFAAEMAKTTTATKGGTMQMLQQAESMGLEGKTAERAVKNAIALAAAKGGEAQSYLRLTEMLEQGNTAMLNRFLPGLKGVHDESQRTAMAQEMLGKMFKVAEADANTAGSQFNKLKAEVGALSREMGKLVSESMKPLIEKARDLVHWFNELDETTKKYIATAVLLTALIKPGVWAFGLLAAAVTKVWTVVSSLGALSSLTTAMTVITKLATVGPWVALAAAIAGVGYAIARSVYDWKAQEAAMQKSLEAADKLSAINRSKTQEIVDTAGGGKDAPIGQRHSGLQKALDDAEKELSGVESNMNRAKKRFEEVESFWGQLSHGTSRQRMESPQGRGGWSAQGLRGPKGSGGQAQRRLTCVGRRPPH